MLLLYCSLITLYKSGSKSVKFSITIVNVHPWRHAVPGP